MSINLPENEKEMRILYYIKRYPLSLIVIAAVLYLSLFKPSSAGLKMPMGWDKVAHACMYFGLSGVLWLEFLRAHRGHLLKMWHAWVGALICPILFGGVVELLQTYYTNYRSGDWFDLLANTVGVLLASAIGYFILHPRILKK